MENTEYVAVRLVSPSGITLDFQTTPEAKKILDQLQAEHPEWDIDTLLNKFMDATEDLVKQQLGCQKIKGYIVTVTFNTHPIGYINFLI